MNRSFLHSPWSRRKPRYPRGRITFAAGCWWIGYGSYKRTCLGWRCRADARRALRAEMKISP